MPICYARNFAFVHIQKTAGVSLSAALGAAGLALDYDGRGVIDVFAEHPRGLELLRHFRREFPLASLSAFAQAHLPAAVLRDLIGNGVWDGCFTFAFVRNPWDRMVSIYHYLKVLMSRPGVKERQPDNYALIERSPDFASFLRLSYLATNDMTSLLVDDNGVELVEFIGRFEYLQEDMARVSERIGVRLQLPRLNASDHGHYRDYYSPATQAVVARHFARDIERFEYVF